MSPKESSLAFDEVKEIYEVEPELRLIETPYRTGSLSRVFTSDEENDVVIIGGRITVSF